MLDDEIIEILPSLPKQQMTSYCKDHRESIQLRI